MIRKTSYFLIIFLFSFVFSYLYASYLYADDLNIKLINMKSEKNNVLIFDEYEKESLVAFYQSSTIGNRNNIASVGGSCSVLITQSTNNTGYQLDDITAQRISNASTVEICQILMPWLSEYGNELTIHIEIWSDINRAGTQYGSDSNQVVFSNTSLDVKTFTFGTNPQPPGDYFMHFIQDDGGVEGQHIFYVALSPTAYSTTDYDLYSNGVDMDYDAVFTIYTIQ